MYFNVDVWPWPRTLALILIGQLDYGDFDSTAVIKPSIQTKAIQVRTGIHGRESRRSRMGSGLLTHEKQNRKQRTWLNHLKPLMNLWRALVSTFDTDSLQLLFNATYPAIVRWGCIPDPRQRPNLVVPFKPAESFPPEKNNGFTHSVSYNSKHG